MSGAAGHSLAAASVPFLHVARPTLVAAGALASGSRNVVESLFVDRRARGRDQRLFWVRLLSRVRPECAYLFALLACAMSVALTVSSSSPTCAAVGIQVLFSCAVVLQLSAVAAISLALGAFIATRFILGRAEELKDHGVTEEELAAAACAAAYADTPDKRLQELRARGVDSGNWEVDSDLSTDTMAVLINRHAQRALIAFRGSVSRTSGMRTHAFLKHASVTHTACC
jgi:hypothetical protein